MLCCSLTVSVPNDNASPLVCVFEEFSRGNFMRVLETLPTLAHPRSGSFSMFGLDFHFVIIIIVLVIPDIIY